MKKVIKETSGRVRVQTINDLDTRTQQQFKEQCDINNIISKYKKTGMITHLAQKQGVFADVSKIKDYHQSLQKVLDANAAFNLLSAEVRARFQNDPAQLLQFLQDPKNYDEGVKLGLLTPKETKPTRASGDTVKNELNDSKNMSPSESPSTPKA